MTLFLYVMCGGFNVMFSFAPTPLDVVRADSTHFYPYEYNIFVLHVPYNMYHLSASYKIKKNYTNEAVIRKTKCSTQPKQTSSMPYSINFHHHKNLTIYKCLVHVGKSTPNAFDMSTIEFLKSHIQLYIGSL